MFDNYKVRSATQFSHCRIGKIHEDQLPAPAMPATTPTAALAKASAHNGAVATGVKPIAPAIATPPATNPAAARSVNPHWATSTTVLAAMGYRYENR